ncbi:MAG: redoxin domain-containing protein [Verrucomicrobia bacterium]|nr:redoxin domain-containing protein [Verrucomicrobiota bacterium]
MKPLLASALILSFLLAPVSLRAGEPVKTVDSKPAPEPLKIGQPATDFRIKDTSGKEISLAELSAKGPVLVRLTCGCLGCDKELPYFQALHEAYKSQGLVSLAVFREPDTKVETYVKQKQLDMLYAVDSKGASWDVWHTKTMPSNFLVEKGGKIAAISTGCDPSGLIAKRLSEKAAGLVGTETVDVKSKVDATKTPKK